MSKEKPVMNLLRVNTTAFEEEDFFLVTDLHTEEIEKIIQPIVEKERRGEEEYENEELFAALKIAYPHNVIIYYENVENLKV